MPRPESRSGSVRPRQRTPTRRSRSGSAPEPRLASTASVSRAPTRITRPCSSMNPTHSVLEFARVRPNPVADARKPEADASDPDIHFLSEEEVEALLRAVPDDNLGATDRALYLTAALTGL